MRWNICCKCLLPAVCVMMLADCAKRSASLSNTPTRARRAVPGAAPPPVTASKAQQTNRNALLKPASKSASASASTSSAAARPARLAQKDAPSLRTLAFVVPVEGGAARIDLGASVRDVLNNLASTAFVFECPSPMRAGFAEHARLTISGSLNDQLRDQLQARGIPASDAAAIVILVDADLTSPDKEAVEIFVDLSRDKRSLDERVWRVRAPFPGSHELNLKVTLSAQIPPAGEVQGRPVILSRAISVVAGENVLKPYRPGIAGCVAGLLCAWIAWTLWRNRRSTLVSHR